MSQRCREGHLSEEPDYCSVCGVSLAAGPAPVAAAPAPASVPAGACPACGEQRSDPGARFCEVCRFDFVAGKQGPPPVAGAQPSAAPAAQPAPAPVASAPVETGARAAWEAVVTIDSALDTEPDPATPCPTDEPEKVFPVDVAEMLIGRRDDRRDIHPEIPLRDPGASRRHAKLLRNPDGSVTLLDLASANGTRLNGVEVQPGARRPLQAGDAVTLGRWTRLVLRRRP